MTRSATHRQSTLAGLAPSEIVPFGAVPAQRQASPAASPVPADVAPAGSRGGRAGSALALAALGLVFGLVPPTGVLAVACGALAVASGVLGLRRARRGWGPQRAMSLVAAELGVVALLMGVSGVLATMHLLAPVG